LRKNRAVFLDRDGVINDLVYDEEEGKVSSPFAARELRVFPYVGSAVRQFKEMGFKVIVISNQPGVAKRQFTLSELDKMTPSLKFYAMGIQANLWKHFMMGADLVLVPSNGSAPASAGGGR